MRTQTGTVIIGGVMVNIDNVRTAAPVEQEPCQWAAEITLNDGAKLLLPAFDEIGADQTAMLLRSMRHIHCANPAQSWTIIDLTPVESIEGVEETESGDRLVDAIMSVIASTVTLKYKDGRSHKLTVQDHIAHAIADALAAKTLPTQRVLMVSTQ